MNKTEYKGMNHDMYKLMQDRVSTALRDTCHTCQIGGMDPQGVLELAVSILLQELVRGVAETNCNRDQFIDLCCLGWDHLAEGSAERQS